MASEIPQRRLTLEKVITLSLLRFFLHVKDLKDFHRIIQATDIIRELPNYEIFLKATNTAFTIITVFMQILLLQNRMENEKGIHFIDATLVSTCLNRRIYSHKLTSAFASRGKSTKGWFYCDAGYLKKSKGLMSLAESGRFIGATTRLNMNRLISNEQWNHLSTCLQTSKKKSYQSQYHKLQCSIIFTLIVFLKSPLLFKPCKTFLFYPTLGNTFKGM